MKYCIYLVPALVYAVDNNLIYYANMLLPLSMLILISNLGVIPAAIATRLVLKKTYSVHKVIGMLLICCAVCVAKLGDFLCR